MLPVNLCRTYDMLAIGTMFTLNLLTQTRHYFCSIHGRSATNDPPLYSRVGVATLHPRHLPTTLPTSRRLSSNPLLPRHESWYSKSPASITFVKLLSHSIDHSMILAATLHVWVDPPTHNLDALIKSCMWPTGFPPTSSFLAAQGFCPGSFFGVHKCL